jgi:hypothetical protein
MPQYEELGIKTIQGTNSDKSVDVHLTGGNVQQPTDLQSRFQQTIQTHNAVSVSSVNSSFSTWIDTMGYTDIAVTLKNDAATDSQVDIGWSHDGVSMVGREFAVVPRNTVQYKVGLTQTKSRYAQIIPYNADVAAHTMSAWAYLKV